MNPSPVHFKPSTLADFDYPRNRGGGTQRCSQPRPAISALEILAYQLPRTGARARSAPGNRPQKPTVRLWADRSPFELQDCLKRRRYRWSGGSDGRPRSWYIDLVETAVDEEIAFLKTEIYLRDIEPRLQTLTAFTRF
jgi:DNA polymerase III subunit epsilon